MGRLTCSGRSVTSESPPAIAGPALPGGPGNLDFDLLRDSSPPDSWPFRKATGMGQGVQPWRLAPSSCQRPSSASFCGPATHPGGHHPPPTTRGCLDRSSACQPRLSWQELPALKGLPADTRSRGRCAADFLGGLQGWEQHRGPAPAQQRSSGFDPQYREKRRARSHPAVPRACCCAPHGEQREHPAPLHRCHLPGASFSGVALGDNPVTFPLLWIESLVPYEGLLPVRRLPVRRPSVVAPFTFRPLEPARTGAGGTPRSPASDASLPRTLERRFHWMQKSPHFFSSSLKELLLPCFLASLVPDEKPTTSPSTLFYTRLLLRRRQDLAALVCSSLVVLWAPVSFVCPWLRSASVRLSLPTWAVLRHAFKSFPGQPSSSPGTLQDGQTDTRRAQLPPRHRGLRCLCRSCLLFLFGWDGSVYPQIHSTAIVLLRLSSDFLFQPLHFSALKFLFDSFKICLP